MQPVNMTEKIRGILEDMIFRDKLRVGDQLESNSELARRFGVSTLTADRAVRLLVNEGLVYRKQGVGTFIAERNAPNKRQVCRIGVADAIFPAAPEWQSAMGIRTRTGIQYFYSKQCEVKMLDYPTVCDPERLSEAAAGLDGLSVFPPDGRAIAASAAGRTALRRCTRKILCKLNDERDAAGKGRGHPALLRGAAPDQCLPASLGGQRMYLGH